MDPLSLTSREALYNLAHRSTPDQKKLLETFSKQMHSLIFDQPAALTLEKTYDIMCKKWNALFKPQLFGHPCKFLFNKLMTERGNITEDLSRFKKVIQKVQDGTFKSLKDKMDSAQAKIKNASDQFVENSQAIRTEITDLGNERTKAYQQLSKKIAAIELGSLEGQELLSDVMSDLQKIHTEAYTQLTHLASKCNEASKKMIDSLNAQQKKLSTEQDAQLEEIKALNTWLNNF